jgi:N-acetyl-anhydromuramyl-L-alanine amidase AmpD
MRLDYLPWREAKHHGGTTTKYAVAIHCTDNDASAEAEAAYAATRTDSVSTHFVVDGHAMWQCLDTMTEAYHAGSVEGNTAAIAVEFVGTTAKSRTWWLDNIAWGLVGRALADVCRRHKIPVVRRSPAAMDADPTIAGFYSHNDMRIAWGGTTHTDPGPNFPWDRLFETIADNLTTEEPAVTITTADLTYDPRTKPAAVGNRSAGTLLADVWGQEIAGQSPVDQAKSYRTTQLDTMAAGVAELVGREPADIDLDALADKIAARVTSRVLAVLTIADAQLQPPTEAVQPTP